MAKRRSTTSVGTVPQQLRLHSLRATTGPQGANLPGSPANLPHGKASWPAATCARAAPATTKGRFQPNQQQHRLHTWDDSDFHTSRTQRAARASIAVLNQTKSSSQPKKYQVKGFRVQSASKPSRKTAQTSQEARSTKHRPLRSQSQGPLARIAACQQERLAAMHGPGNCATV